MLTAAHSCLSSSIKSPLDDLQPYLKTLGTGLVRNEIQDDQDELLAESTLSKAGEAAFAPKLKPRKRKRTGPDTLGPKWFDMPATQVTPEIKTQLKLLKVSLCGKTAVN